MRAVNSNFIRWSWKYGESYHQSTKRTNIDVNEYNVENQQQHNKSNSINKREDISNKMDERALVCQRGFNPFTANECSSYADHLGVQDKFLKPQDTTNVDYATKK